ncbi:uncharacterized protein LOC112213667 [Bombus impatiens]|nr:uncharacterized protein LOC112213667 [Bombus impatiens]
MDLIQQEIASISWMEQKLRQPRKLLGFYHANLVVSKTLFYFPQLLPKTYLSTPVAFPFSSRSCGILGTSAAIHRITESREILSRIMQEECCWFATQSRCSRISDDVVNCTAFLDCSHHARNKEWYCQNKTMTHPSEVLRQRENYDSFVNERGDGGYVIIGTSADGNRNNSSSTEDDEYANETRKQMTLKLENTGTPKRSSFTSEKDDGNV